MMLNIDIEKNGNGNELTFLLTGRLDTTTAPELEEQLENSLDGIKELIFDFSDLRYVSSAGLRVLIAAQKIMEEQVAYNRITALAGDFFCIYVVDPKTGQYREFSSTAGFDTFELPVEGGDFFAESREQALRVVFQEDQGRVITALIKEKVLSPARKSGMWRPASARITPTS